jgi:hypothetical protein
MFHYECVVVCAHVVEETLHELAKIPSAWTYLERLRWFFFPLHTPYAMAYYQLCVPSKIVLLNRYAFSLRKKFVFSKISKFCTLSKGFPENMVCKTFKKSALGHFSAYPAPNWFRVFQNILKSEWNHIFGFSWAQNTMENSKNFVSEPWQDKTGVFSKNLEIINGMRIKKHRLWRLSPKQKKRIWSCQNWNNTSFTVTRMYRFLLRALEAAGGRVAPPAATRVKEKIHSSQPCRKHFSSTSGKQLKTANECWKKPYTTNRKFAKLHFQENCRPPKKHEIC